MREKLKRLGVLLLVGIMTTLIYSCKNGPIGSSEDSYCVSDSTHVAQFIENLQNPDLMAAEEVVALQQQMIADCTIDSAFTAMSPNVVKTVSTVLLKKRKFIRKKDVVEEFRLHGDIYNNLPKNEVPAANTNATVTPETNKQVDLSSTDLGNRRVISTSYSYRTDTIDGKPVKVQIKTEESYE